MLNVYINGKSVGVGEITAVESQCYKLTLRTLRTEMTLEIKASFPSHRQNCRFDRLFR